MTEGVVEKNLRCEYGNLVAPIPGSEFPEVGAANPHGTSLRIVERSRRFVTAVLPELLGPTGATSWPGLMVRQIPERTGCSP
jgi:hypothetical protein